MRASERANHIYHYRIAKTSGRQTTYIPRPNVRKTLGHDSIQSALNTAPPLSYLCKCAYHSGKEYQSVTYNAQIRMLF